MGSGIILIREYIGEPVFERYFEPVFGGKDIYVTDRHFFGHLPSEGKALLALKGNVTKNVIYDVMAEAVSIIEKENEKNNFRGMHESERPDGYHLFPSLIDNKPKIIGVYGDDNIASKFFESVGLEYVVGNMEERVSRSVENMEREFKTLGQKFSKF